MIFNQDNRCLFLKRTTPPRIWGLPGGRLLPNENPLDGLQREIMEECGIQVEVRAPAMVWFGFHDRDDTLGIIFLCKYLGGMIKLSDEHSDYSWLSEDEIISRTDGNAPNPENSVWGRAVDYIYCSALKRSLDNDLQHP